MSLKNTTATSSDLHSWPLPEGVKTLEVGGYEMAYTECGSGPPIVLVHGAGQDFRFWGGQMKPLSLKYRAIAVSLRHYYPEPWRGQGHFGISTSLTSPSSSSDLELGRPTSSDTPGVERSPCMPFPRTRP